jgi:predicted DNA-binding protein YlxM (UPF0122 family)
MEKAMKNPLFSYDTTKTAMKIYAAIAKINTQLTRLEKLEFIQNFSSQKKILDKRKNIPMTQTTKITKILRK